MKIKIATKIYNEEYYIDYFIKYHLESGIDEIHIFDAASDDKSLKIIKKWQEKTDRVKLIESNIELRLTTDQHETAVCNKIFKHAVDEQIKNKDDCWWIFPDIDEFINLANDELFTFLSKAKEDIIRCVFFEWYVHPEKKDILYPIEKMLEMAQKGELKGRIVYIFTDPFYKDYLVRINQDNFEKFKNVQTYSGNHRFILKSKVIVPPNEPSMIIHHLRGGSKKIIMERINRRLSILESTNEWGNFTHFNERSEEINNYDSFYKSLYTLDKLLKQKEETINYNNKASRYNLFINSQRLQN
ncbi:MAG: glycosyltransferase family 2 protein [Candidatus Hodarchaeota archaeon]